MNYFKLKKFIKIIKVIILVPELLFFFLHHKSKFKNHIVLICCQSSFGWNFVFIDWFVRFYANHESKIVIKFPSKRSNKYLPEIFDSKFLMYDPKFSLLKSNYENNRIKARLLELFLLLYSSYSQKTQLINAENNLFNTLKIKGETKFYDYSLNEISNYQNFSGYNLILDKKIGKSPSFSKKTSNVIRDKIKNIYPDFFDKPLATFILRNKAKTQDFEFYNVTRDADNPSDYKKGLKYLSKSHNLVCTGETDPDSFKTLDNFYDPNILEKYIDKDKLNLFLLMNADVFIGQHSGPHGIASSVGIRRILLCDSFPFFQGSFLRSTLICQKRVMDKLTNTEITLFDLLKNHEEVIYGKIDPSKYYLKSNTEEEIYLSIKEMINPELNKKDQDLIDEYYELVSNYKILLKLQGNRPPLCKLK
jgi:putative glycosyltransferase (TIGR04372 family)